MGEAVVYVDGMNLYRTYEEKLTDVALGVTMVKDAAQGYGDLSILITTDTDLTPAINAPAELAPERPIYLLTSGSNPASSTLQHASSTLRQHCSLSPVSLF